MKKINLITLILLFVTQISIANEEYSRNDEFAKRKLLLVLYEEDATTIQELTKKGDNNALEKYKLDIKKYNDNIQSSFKEYWGDKPQEAITMSSAQLLKNEELEKFTIITSEIESKENIEFFVFTLNFIYSTTNKKGVKKYFYDTRDFKVSLQSEVPTKADFLFLTTKLKIYFGLEKEFDRTGLEKFLAKKTLLIDKDITSMSSAEIKEAYSFPFKVLKSEQISELVDQNDKNSLYFKLDIDYIDKMTLINFMIIDCETGKIISRCNLSGLTKVSWNMPSEHHKKNLAFYNPKDGNVNTYPGTGYGHVGAEIMRIYTKQATLKKTQLTYLSSEKKQFNSFKKLMLY